ncbi:hypothetical protein IIA29_00765 [candidate division KSB1 bacterium]|nr:hypothetical protein [candidate division KSB1 bacterium]
MKTVLWISFYFISFLAMIVGLYYSKEQVVENTKAMPVLNYTRYHLDAMVEDTTYTETIDSLAVVVEGLLTELSEYVSQLHDRDFKLRQQRAEIKNLKHENDELMKIKERQQEVKIKFSKAQEEKKLQEMSKMLGSMKPDVLSPVLANLPDNLVQIFYDKAKSRDKAKIFKALPPDRAVKILKKIVGNIQTQ